MAITKQQVFDAADKLLAETGKVPILEDVRKVVRGSYTTLGPWFAEWKAKQAVDSAPRRAPVPASILTAAQGLAGAVWDEATDLAGIQLAAEREALAEAQRRLEDEKTEMAGIADRLTEEVDTLKSALAAATAAQQKAVAERDKLTGELSATMTRTTTAEARIAEMETRFKDLNHALQLAHTEQKAEREQYNVEQRGLQAEMKVEREQRQRQVEALSTELREARAELAKQTTAAEVARAQLAESQNEARTARTEQERTRAEMTKLTTTAELARVRLEESQKRTADDAAALKQMRAAFDAARAEAAKATAAATAAETIAADYKAQLAQENARFDTLAVAIAAGPKLPKTGGK